MKRTIFSASLLGILGMVISITACQKDFSIETGASYAATGTLYDSSGNCMTDSVVGTFYDGITPGRDTAYVLVKVNVVTAGTYNIVSNTQNGLYFSDSGYFSATGINTIKLKPVGTPIIPGTNSYTITFDSSTCYFSITTKDSTGTGLGGTTATNPNLSDTAWKFTGPSGSYQGPVDTAYTKDSLGIHYLYIAGHNTGDSILYMGVAFSGGVIATGSYSSSSSALFRFTDSGGTTIYTADPTVSGVNTVITISSYNATTNIVTGTFTGTANNASGTAVNITQGSFTIKVQ
jgi:hypothetical protein